jgi:hypothetical protein
MSWRWMVSFTPRSLYPRGKSTSPQWLGGWVDPTAGLDIMDKRLASTGNRTPAVQLVAGRYGWGIPASVWMRLLFKHWKLSGLVHLHIENAALAKLNTIFIQEAGYPDWCFRCFLQFPKAIPEIILHSRFFPYSLQYIIHSDSVYLNKPQASKASFYGLILLAFIFLIIQPSLCCFKISKLVFKRI